MVFMIYEESLPSMLSGQILSGLEVTGLLHDILVWHGDLPLLPRLDDIRGANGVIGLLLAEIEEAFLEYEKYQSPESKLSTSEKNIYRYKEASELTDVVVFLISEIERRGERVLQAFLDATYDKTNFVFDEAGRSDNFYKILNARVKSLAARKDTFHNEALSILQLILSRVSFVTAVPFDQLVSSTLSKNRRNRPAVDKNGQIYGNREGGFKLNESEAMRKFHQIEFVLRSLRDHYGSPLEHWIPPLVSELLHNWQDLSLADQLAKIITEIDQILIVNCLSLCEGKSYAQWPYLAIQLSSGVGVRAKITPSMNSFAAEQLAA